MDKVVVGAEEKYFETKFDNLNEKIDNLLTSMNKHDYKIDVIEKKVTDLESFRDYHVKEHDNKVERKQFSIGQVVVLIVCVVTILSDKFL